MNNDFENDFGDGDDFDDFDEVDEDEDSIIMPVEDLETKDVFVRLSKDIREAAKLINRQEARYIVDLYYAMQGFRTRAGNMKRGMAKGEPSNVLDWVFKNASAVEQDIKAALGIFAKSYSVGQWMQGIHGVGPVISAGMLAIMDVRNAKTVGHWWRFAGLDPSLRWVSADDAKKLVSEIVGSDKTITDAHVALCGERIGRKPETILKAHKFLSTRKKKGDDEPPKEKKLTAEGLAKAIAVRPWNAKAKVLCFKVATSFHNQKNNEKDFYGKLIDARRAYEDKRNDAGDYAALAEEKAKKVGKGTVAYKSYSVGKLPKGHLQMRSFRYVSKLFLSHLHTMCYRDYFKADPPVPFAFSKHCSGDHRHYIEPPVIDIKGGKSLDELFNKR